MSRRDPTFGIILCMNVAFLSALSAIDIMRAAPLVVGPIVAASFAFMTTAICRSIYRDRIA
jgi:hypothetical protein